MLEKSSFYRNKSNWLRLLILIIICSIFLYVFEFGPPERSQKAFSSTNIENFVKNKVESISIRHSSTDKRFTLKQEDYPEIIYEIRKLEPTNDFKSKGAKPTCTIVLKQRNGDRSVIEVARGYTVNHPNVANFMTYSGNNSYFYDRFEAPDLCIYIENKTKRTTKRSKQIE